jgi:hypothetical protein
VLERVLVHDIQDSTFFAQLHLLPPGGGEALVIDARPSDSIALALRLGSRIFVSEAVMGQAAIMDRSKYEQEMEDFKRFLDQVTPSDFIKYDQKGGADKGPEAMPND